jgi:hypothetical protein
VQPKLALKDHIHISGGIFRRQQFVAVKNRIGAGKKAERLTFLATPMLETNSAALRDKVEERLMIERRQFRERHNS